MAALEETVCDTNSKSSGTTASSTAGGDEAKDTSSDSGSGDAAGSGDWVAAADEADDAVPGENDDRAFAKFDHVVEVHYGYQIDPKDTTLPDGDSVDNNQYTRYLLDNYNIKVVCDWTAGNASDFQQKVSLAIASASLPDAVVAPTRNYLVQAARADLLADLWPEFNQYASKQVKEIIETTEGRAINNATVDGTFCALPNISVDTDGVYLYFIRQDWLDQLGLEVPKTVDELGEVAQKFKDAGLSPDYAIAGIDNGGRTYSNFLNSSNNGYGFNAVYQAFNATPGYFLKDDSGELYWGTTTDEMKEALPPYMTGMKKASSTRRLEPQPTATMQTMLRTEPAVSSWDHGGALDTETRIPSVTITMQTGRHIRCTPKTVSGIFI